jgi:Ca-activated chloride channel family protein
VVVFLTDGRPTVGNINEDQILENATKSKTGLTRVFCFGIGTDVNTHLLDKVAEETKAFSQYVFPEEDIEVKVSAFFTKIKEPVLASPTIKFPDGLRVTKIYPAPVPDIFKGEQLIIAGRYAASGDGAVQIEGNVSGETKKFAYDVKFPGDSGENDFIPRLWATRRVGYLLDEIRLRGESRELKDEVTELARKYGIVTPYTAYLIQEDEVRRNVPAQVQTLRRSPQLDKLGLGVDRKEIRLREMREKEGDAAVASSRSFQALKYAESSAPAIASGNTEAMRGDRFYSLSSSAGGSPQDAYRTTARAIEQQSRFAGGRTFFRNGDKWIDSEVQKQVNAKRVQVQFGSQEYFDLLAGNPLVKSWLALGTKVEFTIGDTVYEVTD